MSTHLPGFSHAAAMALMLAIAGCTAPVVGPTSTDFSMPAAPGADPTQGGTPVQIGAQASGAMSHIFPLQAGPGQPATFDTLPGRSLTVVASAASASTLPASFRLDVGPETTPKAAYSIADLADGPVMPYRSNHTESNQALLDGATLSPARHVLDTVPTKTVGTKDTFWINNGDSNGAQDVQQTATLKRVTDHALIYLDDQATTFTDDQLDSLAKEFENNIYPREGAVFGTPPVPNLDGQDRVYIVISPAVDNFGKEKGLMGYFWSRDALPNGSGGPHSNQKYVLFMSDQLFAYPALTSFGTMAHEYQHLLNFSHKAINTNYAVAEETWLDEGMAMYAMEVAGYGLPAGDQLIAKDLNEFQQNPLAYSLTDWDNNPHHFAYGQNYLFVRYLADRYGVDTMKEIYASHKTGVDCLDEVLQKHGDTFAKFFSAWAIANLVSGTPTAQGTIYNYKNLDLAGQYGTFKLQGMRTTPVTNPDAQVSLRPWGSAYLTYASGTLQSWHINLADPSATRLMGAAIVP